MDTLGKIAQIVGFTQLQLNKIILFSFVMTSLLLSSCNQNKSTGSDLDKEIRNLDFPITLDLSTKEPLSDSISSIGITGFRIFDPLVVVSVEDNNGFLHVYSLPELTQYDNLLKVGGGPNEVPEVIPMDYASQFYDEKAGKTKLALPSLVNSRMFILDFTTNADNRQTLRLDTIIELPSENNSLLTFMLDNERILDFIVDMQNAKIKREILNIKTGEPEYPEFGIEAIEKLNDRQVEDLSKISLLTSYPIFRPNSSLVAEIPGYNNEIQMYDTKTGTSKKIIYKDFDQKISHADQLLENNHSLFDNGSGYEQFFTVIRNDWKSGNEPTKYLDFISWEGLPLGSIQLPYSNFIVCDISLKDGKLYCLNYETDKIDTYDISEFLKGLDVK